MIRVRFLKAAGLYNRHEVASFAASEAEALIEGGWAEPAEAEAARAEAAEQARIEAEAKAKADAEAEAKAKTPAKD